MKRLGILGTLVWDRIWRHDASAPLEAWGGISYSLAAAAANAPAGWEIVPLLKIGADLEAEARRFLATLPLARDAELAIVPEPTNRVALRYHDAHNRCERLTGGVPAWTWAELAPRVAGLDALYVNFISGFEMELATAERLRAGFAGPIHADLHSLLLARDAADGRRTPRSLPEWRAWLRCFDSVQLNADELARLTGLPGDPWVHVAEALGDGLGLVAATRGGDGMSYLAAPDLPADPLRWREAAHDPATRPRALATLHHVPVPGGDAAGDPTGCGDVWGATFFTALLGGSAIDEAAVSANAAAARKLTHGGADGLFEHLRSADPATPTR
jgi:hypothetical protein